MERSHTNYRLIAKLTGMLLVLLACGMALPLAVSVYCRDGVQFELGVSAMMMLLLGLLLRNVIGHGASYEIHERDSFWVTAAIWIVVPLCGTLPYIFTDTLGSFTDALFESFSGFTTTGSSVMPNPEEAPQGLLVYRSLTQWIGGLGLLLFVVAMLHGLNVGGAHLYDAEFSGTQQRKLHPHLSTSVSRMWRIYGLITVVLGAMLMFEGNSLVDSVCLAFSTVSTGGFVTHADGLASLSGISLLTISVFMVLSGVNVALLWRLFTFRWRNIFRDEELRVYLGLMLLAVVSSGVALYWAGNEAGRSFSYAFFHIASTMSTCGYYISVPEHWSFWVSLLTFGLIVVGASAGSTGGGIKLRRIIVLVKYVGNYFVRMMHPNAIFRVKVDGQVVPTDYINKIFAFVFLYVSFIIGGAFVLTLCGSTIPDAVCMASANISNLGPSPLINNMGASLDYSTLPLVGKWALAVLMLAGRLEIFVLIAVFSPTYWRR